MPPDRENIQLSSRTHRADFTVPFRNISTHTSTPAARSLTSTVSVLRVSSCTSSGAKEPHSRLSGG